MPKTVPPRGAARPAPAAPARTKPRAPAQPGRPGAHKLAAWLLVVQGLLTAALSLRLDGNVAAAVAIFGGIETLFGLLVAVGRSATTKAALVFLGTLVVVLALTMSIVPVIWPRAGKAVWVPALFGMLSASGLFGLLAAERSSAGRLAVSLAAIVLGWAGYGFGAYRMAPSSDPLVQQAIEKWGLPDRSFAAQELGLNLAIPEGWSALREGHPLPGSQGALVTFVGSASGGFATLRVGSDPRLAPLDSLLDRIADEIRASHTSFRELERSDALVGIVPARRMRVVRSSAGRSREAVVTVWRDASRTFELTVVVPAGPQAQAEGAAILQGISFRAPLEAAIRQKAAAFAEACPLFSEAVSHRLTVLSADSSVPALFRRGYSDAIRGQGRLDGLAAEGLRESMGDLFGRLSAQDRERIGAYFERLRLAARTEPQDDAAMAGLLCGAAQHLDPQRQARLRDFMSRAANLGWQ